MYNHKFPHLFSLVCKRTLEVIKAKYVADNRKLQHLQQLQLGVNIAFSILARVSHSYIEKFPGSLKRL